MDKIDPSFDPDSHLLLQIQSNQSLPPQALIKSTNEMEELREPTSSQNQEQRGRGPLIISIDTTNIKVKNNEGPISDNRAENASLASSSSHTNQSTTHESQSSGSSQNVCAHCGRENVEIRSLPQTPYSSASSSSTMLLMRLPSQEAAKIRKQESAAQLLSRPSEEDAAEWIYCDLCHKWFHSICVDIQQYELPLIDKFHCPTCRLDHGDSIMKQKRLLHRYVFDDENERGNPMQIGTEAWVQKFKSEYQQIPEITDSQPEKMCNFYANGRELMQSFNFTRPWTKPIKVLNASGLGLRMPDQPDFDVLDVIKALGGHVLVDTIDVYAQQSYTMSLDRFYGFWRKRIRDRLYNVLSLEFSETRLSAMIRSPSLVRELSWVQRFWPNNDQSREALQTEKFSNGAEVTQEKDGYAFTDNPTWHRHSIPQHELEQQEESSRPYVEHFCLMGMKDSYTDFHIDFGGSSVWYHVFKGEKIFFIAQPNAQNLEAFLRWQKDKQHGEKFLGNCLPPGEKLYRLHIRERETLFLPSGWIHSVYTPEDSIVFGGNFLHTLNVPMQLKVNEMENAAETEQRFRFPSFELCNFYAAKSISESLKDCTTEAELADQVLLDAATSLYTKCTEWIRASADKFGIFSGALKQLERELGRQMNLQRKISSKNRPSSRNKSPANAAAAEQSEGSSGWEEMDMEDEDQAEIALHEEPESADDEAQPSSSASSQRIGKLTVKRGNISREDCGDSNAAVLEIESQGPVRLKIKLPCWRNPSQAPGVQIKKARNRPIVTEMEDEPNLDVGAMFSGRSAHGRQLRPSARIATNELTADALSSDDQRHGQKDDGDFLSVVRAENTKSGGSKNFMAQFTAEERKQIELAEHAAELDTRGELFSSLLKKQASPGTKRKRAPNVSPKGSTEGISDQPSTSFKKKKPAKNAPTNKAGEAGTSAEKKPKKAPPTAREKLAKKLGLKKF